METGTKSQGTLENVVSWKGREKCFKEEKLVKQGDDREMTFESGKMKIISNCGKSSFGGGGGRDISLFEVSQRDNGREEVKRARTENS